MNTVIAKTALPKDEYWDKYFHWPTDYFPFNLPACLLTKNQIALDEPERAIITIKMDYDLELEVGLVDEDRGMLHSYYPRSSEILNSFEESFELTSDQLHGKIGFTFIWAFYIPFPKYAKKHPMGIIQFDADHFKGKNTIITITDTRKK